MDKQFGLLINEDGSARVWVGDESTTIDPVRWLNLCETGAEYLGFSAKEINAKRTELDLELAQSAPESTEQTQAEREV